MVRERSVTLQPGREHFLEMAGFMVTTDQQAEGLDVKYRYRILVFKIPTPNPHYPFFRDCYTRNEGQLEFHNIYTYASCQFECKIKESRIE